MKKENTKKIRLMKGIIFTFMFLFSFSILTDAADLKDKNNSLPEANVNFYIGENRVDKIEIEETTPKQIEEGNGTIGNVVAHFNSNSDWKIDKNFADGQFFDLEKKDSQWNIILDFNPDYEIRNLFKIRLLEMENKDIDGATISEPKKKKEVNIYIKDVNAPIGSLSLFPQRIALLYSSNNLIGEFTVDDDGEDGRWIIELADPGQTFENPNADKPSCRDENKNNIIFKYDADDNSNGIIDFGKEDSDWDEKGEITNPIKKGSESSTKKITFKRNKKLHLVDEADADANGDGVIDDGKSDDNHNGIDDFYEKFVKSNGKYCSKSKKEFVPQVGQGGAQKKEPFSFRASDVFKVVGRKLYLQDGWDYQTMTFKDVKFKVSDGKHEFEKTFTIDVNNEKTAKATYHSEGNGGEILMSIMGLAFAGYLICWKGSMAYSAPSEAVDMMSVPTNPRGDKLINGGVNGAKACGLDLAANGLKKAILQGIVQSLTKWVKGGYKGMPSFLSDPQQFLNDASGGLLGNFTNGDGGKLICSHFKVPLKFAINEMIKSNIAYGGYSSNEGEHDDPLYDKDGYNLPPEDMPVCSIPPMLADKIDQTDYFGKVQNFIDPKTGELDTQRYWAEMMAAYAPENNFSIATFNAKAVLGAKIDAIKKENEEDIKRGNGFMSIRQCKKVGASGYSVKEAWQACMEKYQACKNNPKNTAESCDAAKDVCVRNNVNKGKTVCHYTTPGAVVENEVAETVGVERRSVELADSFNELIFALVQQLLKGIFQKDDGMSGYVTYDLSNMPDPVLGSVAGADGYIKKVYSKTAYNLARDLRETSWKILDNYNKELNKILTKVRGLKNGSVICIGTKFKESDCYVVSDDSRSSLQKEIEDKIKDIEKQRVRAREKMDKTPKWNDGTDSDPESLVKAYLKETDYAKKGEIVAKLQRKGMPQVTDAYNEYQNLLRMDIDYYGNQTYDSGNNNYFYGGYYSVLKYVEITSKEGCPPKTKCSSLLSVEDIFDLKLKSSEVPDKSALTEAGSMKTPEEFQRRVERYSYNFMNTGYAGDETEVQANAHRIVLPAAVDNMYYSLVSPTSPAASIGGKKANNWIEFFTKVPMVKMGSPEGKQYNSSTFLSFLASTNKYDCVKPGTSRASVVDCYENKFYGLPIDKFAYYDISYKRLEDKKGSATFPGQGFYKTYQGWDSFKLYIPPYASKVVIMMKPRRAPQKYLYRLHLTYNNSIIDHRDVKELVYQDQAPDEYHSGLKDLFEDGKTVLLNITDYGDDIGNKNTNYENNLGEINNAGIVIGTEELRKYVDKTRGGWLYLDLIADNFVGIGVNEKTSLDFAYYIAFDNNRSDWKESQIKSDLRTEDVTVIDIDMDSLDKPNLTLLSNEYGGEWMNMVVGQVFKEPGFKAEKDGRDLTAKVEVEYPEDVVKGEKLKKAGTYYIVYKVADKNSRGEVIGSYTTRTRKVVVKEKE